MFRKLLSVVAGAAMLVTAAPASAEISPVQAALDAAIAAGNPGMLAVATDFRGAAGVADIHREGEPDPAGRFRIASVSKSFTATIVLQLAAEHELGLDDLIDDHLPGLLPYRKPITIRQLLQHTSGIPRDLPPGPKWDGPEDLATERFSSFTPAEMVRLSTTQPMLFEPGAGWFYSNTGYTVLAMLIEKITGRPFEFALRDRLTRPLDLRDTSLVRDFPLLPRPAARGYEQSFPEPAPMTDLTEYNLSRYFGSGSLISSATDVNTFFHALLGGELLPPDLLAQMKTTTPGIDPVTGQYAGYDYGLGLMRLPLRPFCGTDQVVWGHGGDVPGYNTWSATTERADRQITTMANRDFTTPQEGIVARLMPMVSEFCTPTTTPKIAISAGQLS
ncbi:serine hydrolase domain-containing protein [Amycolatopsis nigrescens]|uniref:serine hydrolase domain-containing protein n=1 Tax=Amycolatopsis nigrescens TaxID=381445 RepID=UPI0003711D72|nr:serine hydrolase domain-containing protein [Amycolatopsis nigrescens]